jgi:hypothetical protein
MGSVKWDCNVLSRVEKVGWERVREGRAYGGVVVVRVSVL